MKRTNALCAALAAALVITGPALAKPVFVAETPGHTRFLIDDASLVDLTIGGAVVRQARILTENPADARLVSGQVGAEGVMQFNCAQNTYREWTTTSIRKDGTRQIVTPPSPARRFYPTRDGSFERKLLSAACTMRKSR
jgi:hypothetical protein